MANVIFEWVGNAPPVAQIESFEITVTALNDEFNLHINNKTITATSLGTSNADQVVADLVALWNSSTYPECRRAIATVELNGASQPTVIQLTASVPGVPFVATMTADGTFASYLQVDNEGPNVWGLAGNYQNTATGAYELPAVTDEVHVRINRPSILYGLTGHALAAVQLLNIRIDAAFTGQIGLSKWNSAGYNEYLPTALYQKTAGVVIGRGSGRGSPMIKLDAGSVLCNVIVEDTGSSSTPDYAALQLDNLGPTSIVNVHNGEVDFFRESSGDGGMSLFRQFGGSCRVFNGAGAVDMTSVDIYTYPNATLFWDAGMGGTAGTYYLHGGNITFNMDLDEVVTNGTMIIDGPARVTYLGGNLKVLTLNHPNGSIDFRNNRNTVAVTTLNWTQGTMRIGDADITITGVLPRGTLTATYP